MKISLKETVLFLYVENATERITKYMINHELSLSEVEYLGIFIESAI